jgi:hypothetical protein
MRFAASLSAGIAEGVDGCSYNIAECGWVTAFTPLAMPGAATYGMNAAAATTTIKVNMTDAPLDVDCAIAHENATRTIDFRSAVPNTEGRAVYQFGRPLSSGGQQAFFITRHRSAARITWAALHSLPDRRPAIIAFGKTQCFGPMD